MSYLLPAPSDGLGWLTLFRERSHRPALPVVSIIPEDPDSVGAGPPFVNVPGDQVGEPLPPTKFDHGYHVTPGPSMAFPLRGVRRGDIVGVCATAVVQISASAKANTSVLDDTSGHSFSRTTKTPLPARRGPGHHMEPPRWSPGRMCPLPPGGSSFVPLEMLVVVRDRGGAQGARRQPATIRGTVRGRAGSRPADRHTSTSWSVRPVGVARPARWCWGGGRPRVSPAGRGSWARRRCSRSGGSGG